MDQSSDRLGDSCWDWARVSKNRIDGEGVIVCQRGSGTLHPGRTEVRAALESDQSADPVGSNKLKIFCLRKLWYSAMKWRLSASETYDNLSRLYWQVPLWTSPLSNSFINNIGISTKTEIETIPSAKTTRQHSVFWLTFPKKAPHFSESYPQRSWTWIRSDYIHIYLSSTTYSEVEITNYE